MAIRLSDIKKETKKISIDYKGDTIEFSYFVNTITPAFLSERMVVDQVKIGVAEWDVVDDEGKPIPVAESADNLPLEFLREILDAIYVDVRGIVDDDEKKG